MKIKLKYTTPENVEINLDVFPILDKPKLVYDKVKTQASHRAVFNGTLEFINDESLGLKDYDLFYGYSASCQKFYVEMYRDCGGEPWIGWFTIYMGKYDHDKKTFSVTPKPYDKFYSLEPIWAKEFNLFQVSNPIMARSVIGVFNEVVEYTYGDLYFETPKPIGNGNGTSTGSTVTGCNGSQFPVPNVNMAIQIMNLIPLALGDSPYVKVHTLGNWFVGEMSGIYKRMPLNNGGYGGFQPDKWSVKMIRTIAYTLKDGNGNDVVPEQDNMWVKDTDEIIGGYAATKWTRTLPYNIADASELHYNFSYTNCGNADQWGNGYDYVVSIIPPSSGTSAIYKHTRTLEDCINFMLTDAGLKLKSEFFSSDELYVDAQPGTSIPNFFQHLLIASKSDIVRPDASNPATLWNAQFEAFITDLCVIFNLKWDVQDEYFVLEHLQYWEQGGVSLGENVVGLDATLEYPIYLEDTNKWEYQEQEFAAAEKFKFEDASSLDWQPMQFEYESMCLGLNTVEFATRILTTDLPMCQQYFQGNIQGLMLLSTSPEADGYYDVLTRQSEFGNYVVPNGYLSWSYLLHKLHLRGRLLPIAKLNGTEIIMTSLKRIKQQVAISLPLCGAEIDTVKLIKTGIGEGLLLTGEEDLKTGIFTANLIHE